MPPRRRPACDPCRFAKLACDHLHPVCSRCRDRDQAARCVYRLSPFKKRKPALAVPYETSSRSGTKASPARFLTRSRRGPNPGYLGSSSHTTFFGHIQPGNSDDVDGSDLDVWSESPENDAKISHGANLIEQFRSSSQVSHWIGLVKTWLAKGVNLALAGPFTESCVKSAGFILDQLATGLQKDADISRSLFVHSCLPLNTNATVTIGDFCDDISQHRARWETLGLFFTVVSRAAVDISYEPLYTSTQDQRQLQRLAMHYSDRCLDISLSLDCLNDLQLILQYENFILHSYSDGDQSHHYWRKLGDVTSSIFALGYHERIEHGSPVPSFLKALRQAAFARVYSADKNISIFFGRPPRILKKYCQLDFLGYSAEKIRGNSNYIVQNQFPWAEDERFDYIADTQWSALCAILKEDILGLFRVENYDERAKKASIIKAHAEAQWLELPSQFRLEGDFMSCDRRPIERDFMVSARLNHLHVLFLLHLALVRRVDEPDADLITISAKMLSLVIEAVILKDNLANSGTSLLWRVVYYGLAAAGIICISLVHQSLGAANGEVSVSRVIQDLNVFVAEVDAGALVQPGDPNYALLAGPTRTIKTLLTRLMSNALSEHQTGQQQTTNSVTEFAASDNDVDWNLVDCFQSQGFESVFWLNLAEHPFLLGTEDATQDSF